MGLILVGAVAQCVARDLVVTESAGIIVDHHGRIIEYQDPVNDREEFIREWSGKYTEYECVRLGPDQFLFPGFVDTHIHAPQYPNAGIGLDLPLLGWLQKYTFPTESSFKDPQVARSVYERVVARTLSLGTTTAAYYSTIHDQASMILADTCFRKGQRAFIGKCNMDTNCPDDYTEDSDDTVESTVRVIDYINSLDPTHSLVKAIVTPRFAPSCSSKLLLALASLSSRYNLPIQTHISENKAEIEWVQKLFPDSKHYTDVYDTHGLLKEDTILAHACHLTQPEINLVKSRNCGIAHCPVSNSALSSGEAPVRHFLNAGIKVGLGTDISGGFTPSILETARHALLVSRHRCFHDKHDTPLSIDEVLYLATLGGAQVCGLEKDLGNFQKGKIFDALLINPSTGRLDLFPTDSLRMRVEKWAFHGDDRNIENVWINGRQINKPY